MIQTRYPRLHRSQAACSDPELSSRLLQSPNVGLHEFLSTLDKTAKILEKERVPRVDSGATMEGHAMLQTPENTVIIGDLHGDLGSLDRILEDTIFDEFLANKNNKMIFLGDYIDRGTNSVAVLYTICKLKSTYPDSVVLMRGNHEAPDDFPFKSHDFPHKIAELFPYNKGEAYESSLRLFKQMTVMATIGNSLLLVHGGLPTETDTYPKKTCDMKTLEEVLWSDPRPIQGSAWEASRRPYGKHFGAPVTEKWLQMTNTRAIVRGHEPCNGFRVDHGGRILTLFSCKESYPRFEAGYLQIKNSELESICNAAELSLHVRLVR